MNILQAKNEIKNTVQAYLSKDSFDELDGSEESTTIIVDWSSWYW